MIENVPAKPLLSGGTERMNALTESIGLQQYRKDADAYGLGYQVSKHDKIEVPAYDAPIGLSYAAVGG